ncbi:MAG: PilZ domain-containing protein [Nitrospirota bacterium]
MDKRREKRFAKKLMARLSSAKSSSWGVLSDISENGLFVRSNKSFAVGTAVEIELVLPDNEVSTLRGVVKRAVTLPASNRRFGIGIELIKRDVTYRFFLKCLADQSSYLDRTLAYAQ